MTHTAAGAANGRRRASSGGNTTSAIAGTANHSEVVVRLVRERDPEGRCERRDHDQGVESVFASQLPQPVHGSNVPQALEPRLRPG